MTVIKLSYCHSRSCPDVLSFVLSGKAPSGEETAELAALPAKFADQAGCCATAALTRHQGTGDKSEDRFHGRDDWIRTSDLTHPKGALYQAEPRPANSGYNDAQYSARGSSSLHDGLGMKAGLDCAGPHRVMHGGRPGFSAPGVHTPWAACRPRRRSKPASAPQGTPGLPGSTAAGDIR